VIPSTAAAGTIIMPLPKINLLVVTAFIAGLMLIAAFLPGGNYD
jgi:hypothetical protein